ncbi:MAG: CARDB domain-containing protein [Planctomycetota bacterium]
MNLRIPTLSLFGLLALAACSSGGGGGGGPSLGNLAVTNVRLLSTDPNAAHEMTLAVSISATQAYEQVPISYVLLNASDVDSHAAEVRQHEVSTSVISPVTAGANTYEVFVVIPSEAREDGNWYLIPHLDPANAVPETDENDNEPTDHSRVPVAIGNGNTDRADIVLESATVEQDAVVLWPVDPLGPALPYSDPRSPGTSRSAQDRSNHDFDATLEASTTGTREIQRLDITATIAVPGSGSQALWFWDPDRSVYETQIFAAISPGVPTTVNMDVHIPPSTRSRIEAYLRSGGANTFEVTFSSNMTAGIAEWENGSLRHQDRPNGNDDQIRVNVVIVLPPTPQPNPCNDLAYDSGYRKDWKNATFGVGVDFGAGASLDRRGAIGEAHAAIPVKLFGAASKAVELQAYGRVLPREGRPTDSEFRAEFKMFGVALYSRNAIDPSVTYLKEETFTKTYEVRGRVFAGPIPIQLVAQTTGTMGYSLRAYLDPARMEVQGQAFGRIEAFASASVNVVVVEAGVAGAITLLDDVFTATATCQLGTPGNGQLTGTLRMQAINELTGPNGRIYLYESHTEPKWCYQVIPCGLRRVRNEKTLARFQSFAMTDVLFDKQEQRTVCLQ